MMFCVAPIASATPHASGIEVKLAKRAAASAGTTCKGRMRGSTEVIGPASTATTPTTRQARRVLAIERRLGERPAHIAEASLSKAARVSSPKRL